MAAAEPVTTYTKLMLPSPTSRALHCEASPPRKAATPGRLCAAGAHSATSGHVRPRWVTLGHFGSHWVTLGHIGSRWVTLGHIGSLWVTLGLIWSRLVKFGHVGSRSVSFGHVWSNSVTSGPIRSHSVTSGPHRRMAGLVVTGAGGSVLTNEAALLILQKEVPR
eukprot:12724-Prorocentrum_minimum.AAC.1